MKIKGCKKATFLDQAIKNGGQAIFYVLRCYDKDEEFFKVGITVNHILTRYGSVKAMPYSWEILLELPASAEETYDMEVKYKREMEQFQYTPSIPFNGSKTECYLNLTEEFKKFINDAS